MSQIGITQQAMTKLTGRDDWGTPKLVVDYIERNYVLKKFEIDACASDYNHKCDFYITKKMNMFRHQLKKTFFMNPIYGKKGTRNIYKVDENNKKILDEKNRPIVIGQIHNEYGTADFVKFAHDQHFKHNSTGAVLLFANVSSSDYYQKFVGETPDERIKNHCDIFMYPRRIAFENPDGSPVGTPSLSSMVVVYDERFAQ